MHICIIISLVLLFVSLPSASIIHSNPSFLFPTPPFRCHIVITLCLSSSFSYCSFFKCSYFIRSFSFWFFFYVTIIEHICSFVHFILTNNSILFIYLFSTIYFILSGIIINHSPSWAVLLLSTIDHIIQNSLFYIIHTSKLSFQFLLFPWFLYCFFSCFYYFLLYSFHAYRIPAT